MAQVAPDGRPEASKLRAAHPDWLLPAWADGGASVWTVIGAPYSGTVALVGPRGTLAPRNHGPAVDFWLYDTDNSRLVVPDDREPRVRLDEGDLPIVTTAWDSNGLHVEITSFTGLAAGDPGQWFEGHGAGTDSAITFVRLSVESSARVARHFEVFVALRPYGIERTLHSIATASCEVETAALVANGDLILVGAQPADACGATSLEVNDLSAFAARNQVPDRRSAWDASGRAQAMLRFGLTVAPAAVARLEFRAPAGRISAGSERAAGLGVGVATGSLFDQQRVRVANAWRSAVGRVLLDVPDARVASAFRASQAYLMLNRRGDRPRSGPLAHDAFWIRDAVYIGEALERMGYSRENQATLDALAGAQRDDGSFPAINDLHGRPADDEWDCQGEAIAALVAHYRYTHDRRWLEDRYATIAHAAGFLDALRGRTLLEGVESRTLMPANTSAEDLGPSSWHHYWDDFWAIVGYREASFAALELDRQSDAAAFEARADDLEQSLLRSVRQVQQRTATKIVPNGPEDVLSSSMARGTTPALWPVRALRSAEWRQLLNASFPEYFRLWMEPQGGGYRHVEGTLWPYGGLGIAHAMLRLGMLDQVWQVLEWTLSHPTLPGAHAWGEAINPRTGGLELGDMPHSWAAAEMVSLIRDMLLTEEDGTLLVNAGAPEAWFTAGKQVALRDAPTHYGPVSVTMRRDELTSEGVQPNLRIQLDGSPPRGWLVRLPGRPLAVTLDDVPASLPPSGYVGMPTGPHTLVVGYAGPSASAQTYEPPWFGPER